MAPPVSLGLAGLAGLVGLAQGQVGSMLAPTFDINLPSSSTAQNPLRWLGANGPYAPGDNVFGISSDVPEGCTVDMAFYVSRHGSRYPDPGAYSGWVDMQQRFAADNGYTATGSLSFLPSWQTVLTQPDLQIANISPTGRKELFDMAYTLRTRYPQLYNEGDELYVWANNYSRVLETARLFTTGFLGVSASSLGHVVSVTSKGFVDAVGNSLAPSDSCPNFADTQGVDQIDTWAGIYVPPIQARLQKLISGNLTLTANDVQQIPYLCGFESQILGRLSPWCGVFTDEELQYYQYANDLRYYYGVGPGTDLPATMMQPYLSSVVQLLAKGPGQTGTLSSSSASGNATFAVPNLLVSFLNDGQLNELLTAMGVHDNQATLDPAQMDPNRLYIGNRFTTMKGQVALERLNCAAQPSTGKPTTSAPSSSFTTATRPSSSSTIRACRAKSRNSTSTATTPSSASSTPAPSSSSSSNYTYIRVTLNDIVYPIPSCQNGPGSSCLLSDYLVYVADKYNSSGNWATNCNVTTSGVPSVVQGASFYTDLSSDFLQIISP